MKKMKKLAGILLAMVMVIAMAIPTTAAGTTELITGHTFKAFQIFKGTAGGDGSLGDVEWGDGIDTTTIIADLAGANILTGITAGSAVADVTKALSTADAATAQKFAKFVYGKKTGEGTTLATEVVAGDNSKLKVTTALADGYYLIVDTAVTSGTDAVNNAALLQVTGKDDIEIQVKTDKPSVEKKVKENVKNTGNIQDANNPYGQGYNDVADYNIGDTVPFAFYSTVPDMTYFDTYKYVFHDTMSAGLTLKNDAANIKVKIGNKDLTYGTDFKVATSGLSNNETFTITIANLKGITGINTGDKIVVTYNAELNTGAVIGLDGNPNEVYLEYSNNPNDESETGKTPTDKVIVFTYELDTTKVDGQDANLKLKDAEFVLYKMDGTNKKYVTVNAEGKVTGWGDATEADGKITYPENSTLKSDDDGLFKVIGLDDGTYFLKETKAPKGYNLLTADIPLVIKATTENGQNWAGAANQALTALKINVDSAKTDADGNTATGIVSATVKNNKGATLPETGGIGTTIFYVLGSVLVLAAAILLITKKRMSAQK